MNFPREVGRLYGAALQEEVSAVGNGDYAITITNCVFDASFTNAYPIARIGTGSRLEIHNVILPEGYRDDFSPDVSSNVIVSTNAVVAWSGHAIQGGLADTHGIGAMIALGSADEVDTDGDGLRDWEEIYIHSTDPFKQDGDGDKVSDSDEIADQTDPNDGSDYKFTLELTRDYPLCTNHVVEVSLGEIALDDNYIATYHVTNGVPPVLSVTNGDTTIAIPYRVTGRYVHVVSNDADNDDLPDLWELSAGLNPMLRDDATEDSDGDGLINLHEFWALCNPGLYDGTNTLLSVCTRAIDSRLAGKCPLTTIMKFDNYQANGTNFVLNASFWASDVDTSCASMWNDARHDYWGGGCDEWNKAGTAISKRHIITAWHYPIPIGATIWFMGNDGVPCSRTVTGIRSIGGDICVQSLDVDLPDTVVPAKILPANYYDYIQNGKRLPTVMFDQEEKFIVADLSGLKSVADREISTSATLPIDSVRASFYETVVGGDSGSPRFLLVGNELVLLYVMHTGGGGSGCFITHYKTDIQNAMNSLCPGYTLEEVDLSEYETLNQ